MSTTTHPYTGDEQGYFRHRWLMLAVMCLALIVTSLDTLIVTVALPSIETALGANISQLQWIVAAYSLAFSAPLLFVGGLADRYGCRLFFMLGMIVILAGSVGAVLSESVRNLIFYRVTMGLGAAMIMPSTLALIRHIFPAEERAKAIGVWVSMGSVGVPLGPIVGGLLLEQFSWGSIFLVNVPLVGLAIIGCVLLVPETKKNQGGGLDIIGLALSVIGPLFLVYGVIDAPNRGWTDGGTATLIVIGVMFICAFLFWERKISNPMLSHAVFSDRRFGGPLITIATVFFGVFGCLFIVTQHLQFTLGYGPLAAGLHMLAMCSVVLVAPIAPKLVERFGIGPVTMFGPLFVAAGIGILAIGDTPSNMQILISLAALGLGIGIGAPPSVDSIIESTPKDQSGAGSAVADVALQFGGALGIAVMGSTAPTTLGSSVTSLALPALVGAGLAAIGAICVRVALHKVPNSAN